MEEENSCRDEEESVFPVDKATPFHQPDHLGSGEAREEGREAVGGGENVENPFFHSGSSSYYSSGGVNSNVQVRNKIDGLSTLPTQQRSHSQQYFNHHLRLLHHPPPNHHHPPIGSSPATRTTTITSGSTASSTTVSPTLPFCMPKAAPPSKTETNISESNGSNGGGGRSSSPTGSSSSRQFRDVVEMLILSYLENGGTVRSEEFKNLFELFLCPIFEPVGVVGAIQNDCNSAGVQVQGIKKNQGCQFENTREGMVGSVADGGVEVGASLPSFWDSLACTVCYGVLIEPVTIPCGHSYCRKCLQKQVSGFSCRRCTYILTNTDIYQSKTNVLVGSLVEKWWKEEIEASKVRSEGNALFERQRSVGLALEKYSEALSLTPCDHLSLSNRSHVLLTAGNSEDALRDAEAATRLCPAWPKGYFRKATALISLGRYEDAFLSLSVCLYLLKFHSWKGKDSVSISGKRTKGKDDSHPVRIHVINEMIKILQKLFLQSTALATGSTLRRPHWVIGERYHNRKMSPYPRNMCLGRRGSSATGCCSSGIRKFREKRKYRGTFELLECNDSSGCNSSSGDEENDNSFAGGKNELGGSHTGGGVFTTTALIEHLTVKISRLLSRASQDLKGFEVRLKVFHLKSAIRRVQPSVMNAADVECSLCYRLLFQPVSTGCGHTFCRSCLDRCLDHNPACPLCKASLQHYLLTRQPSVVTEFLEKGIQKYFAKELAERANQHMEELNVRGGNKTEDGEMGDTLENRLDIPIFVCTMAFPTVPCPLHVFEPRYRLMIRRCMENGTNRFGMCCYQTDGENNYGDIGTLLEIKNIQYFADGRSVLKTVGIRRFKVIRKTVVDGYNAATVSLLNDRQVFNEDSIGGKELHDRVFAEATQWFQSVGQVRRQRIQSHFGAMPLPEENWESLADGPSWLWWLLAILPLDPNAQLSILSMCSLQKRLECVLKILSFVKNGMSAIGE